ncbi:hypothetical protein BDP27DRAFT_1365837 [Rhodocollybia butyracea]|uniref:Uncharacterized protein n=1 Tax=Rhodocollybia butyracea TaxID=206335 RepID=A0A9P5U5T6_9AGAR|nr:hypothetical protein BDP27DRAFT_1365837 [Rhodocollybia butyracea]
MFSRPDYRINPAVRTCEKLDDPTCKKLTLTQTCEKLYDPTCEKMTIQIDYTKHINMIGPDGKNPIGFKPVYKETFTAQFMRAREEPNFLEITHAHGRIYGMSLFNVSFEIGEYIFLKLSTPLAYFSGTLKVKV